MVAATDGSVDTASVVMYGVVVVPIELDIDSNVLDAVSSVISSDDESSRFSGPSKTGDDETMLMPRVVKSDVSSGSDAGRSPDLCWPNLLCVSFCRR